MERTQSIMPEEYSKQSDKKNDLKKELLSYQEYIKKIIRKSPIYQRSINQAYLDEDDILQEVLMKANHEIEQGKFDEKRATLKTWLHRITTNHIIDCYRRVRARPAIEEPDPATNTAPIDKLIDLNKNPEEELLAKNQKKMITSLLEELSPEERKIIELRTDGMPIKQVAQTLGISLDAAKSKIFRVKKHLKSRFAEENKNSAL